MLKQPIGQKLLTNMTIVRLKRQNKNFEIPCYNNKVTDWRNKIESDIGEVLTKEEIYTNVEQGTLANKKDLQKAFGNMSKDDIIIEILNRGEFQLSELERDGQLEKIRHDVANWISSQCVNTDDGNQFPSAIILKAMKEAKVQIHLNKSAKVQGMQMINTLKKVIPIERGRMHLKITFKSLEQLESMEKCLSETNANDYNEQAQNSLENGQVAWLLQIEKSLYRVIQDLINAQKDFYSQVAVEIVNDANLQAAASQNPQTPAPAKPSLSKKELRKAQKQADEEPKAAAAAATESLENLEINPKNKKKNKKSKKNKNDDDY